MVKLYRYFIYFIIVIVGYSCKTIHAINEIPPDTYLINTNDYSSLDSTIKKTESGRKIKMDVEQTDSLLKLTPYLGNGKPISFKLSDIKKLKLYRNTFDIDVLTVPFKIRPSVQGFPEQLTANFDAALYIGRRRDNYEISNVRSKGGSKLQLTGVGYGYGGFIGLGSVTMNPFVTNQAIDYEYDGFVVNGGFAGIYDAKKFNIGLAIGADFLVDKNRRNWIYQGKPWLGVLFGINLN
jgi:hypothetical protein